MAAIIPTSISADMSQVDDRPWHMVGENERNGAGDDQGNPVASTPRAAPAPISRSSSTSILYASKTGRESQEEDRCHLRLLEYAQRCGRLQPSPGLV
ncbi:MAG: hypothetical protein ACRELT_00995, partial [Longimicrobiales bacterium]